MIWKDIKGQVWKFREEKFEESCESLQNPVRGWYSVFTFQAEQKINQEELKWSLQEDETLALVILDIGEFRDKLLDYQALQNIRDILGFFENYKRDVIFRPVYDREGKGMQHEPDDFSLVLAHLQQLGQLLSAECYSVFVFQGMLVGSWGEMHTSKYLSEECQKKMWGILRNCLNENIMMAVRTPAQWRNLVDENDYQKSNFYRTGIFDDGIMGSLSHLGTFGTMTKEAAGWKNAWNRKEELDFLEHMNQMLSYGGEAVDAETASAEDTEVLTADAVVDEMKKLHLVYLNHVHDRKILDKWKNQFLEGYGVWSGKSLYEYVGSHLGYRFMVKKVEIQLRRFRKMKFVITVENMGFGSLSQDAELLLIIQKEKEAKPREYLFSCDIRKWQGGICTEVEVTTEAEEAKVYIRMQRKKDKRTIYFAGQKNTDGLYLGCLYFESNSGCDGRK